jgi:hypothetical protein
MTNYMVSAHLAKLRLGVQQEEGKVRDAATDEVPAAKADALSDDR